MFDYQNIIYTVDENIARIKFNRPQKLNALTKRMWEEFADALKLAIASTAKVVIICGDERAFSAGDDIPSMFELEKQSQAVAFFKSLENVAYLLINMEKPLIAEVDGIAYGGGFEVLLFMDVVIATNNSKFALPEAKLGLIPPFALTVGHYTLGFKEINRLALIGEAIDAFEAYKIGLVNCIVEKNQLKDKTLEIAWKLIANDSASINFIKKWSNKHKLQEEIKETIKELSNFVLSDTAKTRMRNFIEKRREDTSLFC